MFLLYSLKQVFFKEYQTGFAKAFFCKEQLFARVFAASINVEKEKKKRMKE